MHQVYQTGLHFDYANSKKAHLDAAGMTSSRDDREGKAVGALHDFLFRKSVNSIPQPLLLRDTGKHISAILVMLEISTLMQESATYPIGGPGHQQRKGLVCVTIVNTDSINNYCDV